MIYPIWRRVGTRSPFWPRRLFRWVRRRSTTPEPIYRLTMATTPAELQMTYEQLRDMTTGQVATYLASVATWAEQAPLTAVWETATVTA